MDMLKIYLIGSCNDEIDEDEEWGIQIKEKLRKVSEWSGKRIQVVNPTKYFHNRHKYKSQKQVKEFYLYKISQCDLVIANLNNSDTSIETAQEIQFAVDMKKPIIGFGTQNVHPWISEVDCQVVFDTMTEVADCILEYYVR